MSWKGTKEAVSLFFYFVFYLSWKCKTDHAVKFMILMFFIFIVIRVLSLLTHLCRSNVARRRIVKLAGVDKAFQELIKKNLEVKFLNFMISKYFLDLIPSTWPLKKKTLKNQHLKGKEATLNSQGGMRVFSSSAATRK